MAQPAETTGGAASVLIMGTTGSGKSTLANLLLFGEDAPGHGFSVGDGADAETSGLRSMTSENSVTSGGLGACVLQVTDTPGVPDTDRKISLEHYDSIIKYVRQAPGINAIIIMVADDRKDDRVYRDMRALMKQFNTLPCAKLMVFRSSLPPGCTEERRENKDRLAMDAMNRLCESAGLPFAMKCILHDMDGNEVQHLRNLLCQMPCIPQHGLQLRTFGEITADFKNLSDKNSRMEALQKELGRLSALKTEGEAAVAKLQGRLERQEIIEERGREIGGLFAPGLADFIVDLLSRVPDIQQEKQAADARVDEISQNMERTEKELHEGHVNEQDLEKAKEEYDALESLRHV